MKKQGKKKTSTPIMSNDELTRFIKIILLIVVIVVVFYGVTIFITKNFSNSEYDYSNNNPAVLQYDEIILGSILRAPRDEYYVLVVKDNDSYVDLYTTYQQLYEGMESPLKVYTSYLDSVFNQMYIGEESNLMVTNISELRVKDSTLFHVKDQKIVAAYEGKDGIVGQFALLIK